MAPVFFSRAMKDDLAAIRLIISAKMAPWLKPVAIILEAPSMSWFETMPAGSPYEKILSKKQTPKSVPRLALKETMAEVMPSRPAGAWHIIRLVFAVKNIASEHPNIIRVIIM